LGGQAASYLGVGRLNSELGYGGLVLSLSNESVSVLIRALQDRRRIEILSRPQIMTLDNQPAFIQVGERVPRVVGSQVNQVGQVNTVTLENVGLILGVTPRISPDGMVVMEIDAEKSDLGTEAEGIPISISATGEVIRSPRINLTMAQTTVSAMDGQTIVLGGLITKRKSSISRRVPWLSDLPVLGSLFQYNSEINERAELLIFLTPHVIRSKEDAEKMKQLEAARMSWCAADVHELTGSGEFCRTGTCPYCDGDIPVIYPDFDPRGSLPPGSPSPPPAPLPLDQNLPPGSAIQQQSAPHPFPAAGPPAPFDAGHSVVPSSGPILSPRRDNGLSGLTPPIKPTSNETDHRKNPKKKKRVMPALFKLPWKRERRKAAAPEAAGRAQTDRGDRADGHPKDAAASTSAPEEPTKKPASRDAANPADGQLESQFQWRSQDLSGPLQPADLSPADLKPVPSE